jgi:hypothetical protein
MINPSWEDFFYYGENLFTLEHENEFDIIQGTIQPLKSLFYFRQEGAGIQELENYPNSFILLLLGRYNIVKWIAFRNSYVITNNYNRQIIVSQDSIRIDQEYNEVNIDIGYRSYKSSNEYTSVTVLI